MKTAIFQGLGTRLSIHTDDPEFVTSQKPDVVFLDEDGCERD